MAKRRRAAREQGGGRGAGGHVQLKMAVQRHGAMRRTVSHLGREGRGGGACDTKGRCSRRGRHDGFRHRRRSSGVSAWRSHSVEHGARRGCKQRLSRGYGCACEEGQCQTGGLLEDMLGMSNGSVAASNAARACHSQRRTHHLLSRTSRCAAASVKPSRWGHLSLPAPLFLFSACLRSRTFCVWCVFVSSIGFASVSSSHHLNKQACAVEA